MATNRVVAPRDVADPILIDATLPIQSAALHLRTQPDPARHAVPAVHRSPFDDRPLALVLGSVILGDAGHAEGALNLKYADEIRRAGAPLQLAVP